jgi:hypothetical protein
MNGVVERRIAVTARTTYAMLTGAKLNDKFRMRLRAEAKTTANKLKNVHVTRRMVNVRQKYSLALNPNYHQNIG